MAVDVVDETLDTRPRRKIGDGGDDLDALGRDELDGRGEIVDGDGEGAPAVGVGGIAEQTESGRDPTGEAVAQAKSSGWGTGTPGL